MKLKRPTSENQRLILRSCIYYDIWYEIWEPDKNNKGICGWRPTKSSFDRDELREIVSNNHHEYISLPDIVRELGIEKISSLQ